MQKLQTTKHKILASCLCFYLVSWTWFISIVNSLSSEVEQD